MHVVKDEEDAHVKEMKIFSFVFTWNQLSRHGVATNCFVRNIKISKSYSPTPFKYA